MKKTKHFLITLSLCSFLLWNVQAQRTVNSSGGEAIGAGSVSYSVGQIVYTVKTNNNHSITEGVQQINFDGDGTTLAVELLDFEAHLTKHNTVNLVWTTSQERNNDYFSIERSQNGTAWEILTKVTGTGHSTIPIIYQTLDKTPHIGKSYYRLKQIDYDGTYTYSEIEIVHIQGDAIRVYPNPTSNIAILNVGNYAEQSLSYILTDTQGKILMQAPIHQATHQIDLQNISDGTYTIQVRNGENIVSNHQLIKNH